MNSTLQELFDFIRYPSVSADSAYEKSMQECAEFLSAKMKKMGLETQIHSTDGHPIVTGRSAYKENAPTVLIYGHYDVQPVDPLDLWDSDPFEPVLRDGMIYARGATDNKGQIFAHLCGVQKTLEAHGELPVNVLFLIEGEEEVGSANLETFLKQNRDLLSCDIIVVSDSSMVAPGVPALTYSLRGIAGMELHVKGPEQDLHSGMYGGAIANPITILSRLLGSLHDAEMKIAIPGFYDDVAPLENWEKEQWAELKNFEQDILDSTGAKHFFGEKSFTPLERLWARPTAEINGIGGGYQGEGSKTVIPSKAFAKLTFRLVPGQRPSDILEKASAYFRKICPPEVELTIQPEHSGKPYLCDPHSLYGKAAQKALHQAFNAEPKLIREGGSIPIIETFREVLGVDTLLLGLGLTDCNAHAPNESFPVENFEAGIKMNQALLKELSLTS